MVKLTPIFEEILNEKKNRPFKKGCLMANLEIDDKVWSHFLKRIKKEDLYTKEGDDSYGLEDEPHVTILYGLDSKYSSDEMFDYLDSLDVKQFDVYISDIDYFDNEEYNVLKFSVTSPVLNDLNSRIKNNFDYENDYPDYKAHATIAYLKKSANIDSYIEDLARATGLYTGSKPKLHIKNLIYSSKLGKFLYKLKK